MSDYPDYTPPPFMWDAMNDVEEAADGKMYWAIHAYGVDGEYLGPVTQYDLTHEVAWDVVHSHNEGIGLERDAVGLYYRPDHEAAHGGIYWREVVPEDFYAR
jgi:hypothetical protein